MVAGSAGFLLQYHGQRLRHYTSGHSSAGAPGDSSTYAFPNATAHTATHAAAHAAAHTTAYVAANASGTFWSSGPIQLRCGCRKYLGS